jgi:hypothetical protein
MSEIDPNEHDEIARRLRDEGLVEAPSDLAGEVMKRVRAEPRRSTSAVRRPLVTLLAAALITVALVAGIARLGGGSASTAGGGSTGGGAQALSHSAGGDSIVETKDVERVPRAALGKLSLFAPANGTGALPAACPGERSDARESFSLAVPYSAWDSVQAQLRSAMLLPYKPPLVTVHLRRLAPGVKTPGALTCP